MVDSAKLGSYLSGNWIRLAAALAVVAGVVGFVLLSGDSTMESSPADGSNVRVLTGGVRSVQHSTLALPTSDSPQPDGRPTLVWFSATWCTTCARMDPYAKGVLESFGDRFVVVEKSVDHDQTSVDRYGVRATPTFVLIDAKGKEITRFNFVASGPELTRVIEQGLAKL